MIYKSTVLLAIAASCFLSAPLSANEVNAVPHAAQVEGVKTFFDAYPRWSEVDLTRSIEQLKLEVENNKKVITAITKLKPEEMTFDNTFGVLESCGNSIDTIARGIYHLSSVTDNEAIRKAVEDMGVITTELSSWTIANPELWTTVKTAAAQPWVANLSESKKDYVEDTVRGFKLSGADLPADKKERVKAIQKELSKVSLEYTKNMLDSTNAWEKVITDKSQLAGMSDSWLESRAAMALEKGHGTKENPQWLLGLDDACSTAILDLCDVDATRRLVWEGLGTVGRDAPYDNAPLIEKLVTLRQEMSEILGFDNYADMATATRMVKTGDVAMKFVDDFIVSVKPYWEKEMDDFLAFISEERGEKVTAVEPWNVRYYRKQLMQKKYNFDSETMRPYFPADKVLAGSFDIFEKLFNIDIKEIPTACPAMEDKALTAGVQEVWHPDVRLYEVHDKKTGAHLGSFYFDPYPRASKRSGAWCMGMRPGDPASGGKPHTPHIAAVVCNFAPPSGDNPALWSEYEVTVILHEFGHLLHNMLSDTELRSHSGTAVVRDFVEMPSQLMEFWLADASTIPLLSAHYKTGEAMPKEMIEKYLASRHFMPADGNMRQLALAKLDLEIYTNYDEKFKGKTIEEACAAIVTPLGVPLTQPSYAMVRQFPHIMSGGYGAGYYSYKWAEVLCADAYSRFKEEGMLNAKTGADLRESIMSKGGSRDESQQFRDFMGRDPQPDALLKEQGLKK